MSSSWIPLVIAGALIWSSALYCEFANRRASQWRAPVPRRPILKSARLALGKLLGGLIGLAILGAVVAFVAFDPKVAGIIFALFIFDRLFTSQKNSEAKLEEIERRIAAMDTLR